MYYLVYGILYLISLLPLRLLFFISDGFYGLAFHVIKYRRDVVMNNLTIAFPEKTEAEKIIIAKKFYHNFIDSFIETIKMLSVNEKFILKHFTGNWQIINEVLKTRESCHILLGHTFNWELGNHAISLNLDHAFLVVYMPIGNKIFNRLFMELREKGRTKLLSAHNMRKDFMPYRNIKYILALAADQNPGNPRYAYWLNFFDRPTPFVTGPEKGARARNLPVFFCYIEKVRRGYYNLIISMGEENPQLLPEGAVTVKFVRYLEHVIRLQPDMWLWSHKRWKHEWKEEYLNLWIDQQPVSKPITEM